jgi:PhnB protein
VPQPIPYLSFNGNCADAMRFYERVFKGDLQALMTYGETPMCDEMPKEAHGLIMHAFLVLGGGGSLMAGDAPPGMGSAEGNKNATMLALTYATVDEAHKVFNDLADGGTITMPLAPTFWAKTFGMVTDKFGVPWGINGEEIKQ